METESDDASARAADMERGKRGIVAAFVVCAVGLVCLAFTPTRFQKGPHFPYALGGVVGAFLAVYVWACGRISRAKGHSAWHGFAGIAFPHGLMWLFQREDRFDDGAAPAAPGAARLLKAEPLRIGQPAPVVCSVRPNDAIPSCWWRYVYRHPLVKLGGGAAVFGGAVVAAVSQSAGRTSWTPNLVRDGLCMALVALAGVLLAACGTFRVRQHVRFARRVAATILQVGLVEKGVPVWVKVEYAMGRDTYQATIEMSDIDMTFVEPGKTIDVIIDARYPHGAAHDPELASHLPAAE